MSINSAIRPDRLAYLRQLQAQGRSFSVAEALRCTFAQPTGVKYFATTTYEAPNYANLPWRPVEHRLRSNHTPGSKSRPEVLPYNLSYDIGDDTLNLEFIDTDLEMSRLFELHPEGARVELLVYIAEIDQELTLWWGRLSPPKQIQDGILSASAIFGYGSSQGFLPRRYMSSTDCDALYPPEHPEMTLDDIARNDCPVNAHLPGGTIGGIDPATGAVYSSCPHNSRTECRKRVNLEAEAAGDALSYLAFDVIESTETVDQSKGADTLAKTRGNESNLNVPCSVVFGERDITGLPVLTYQIQTNNKKPADGTVSCIFPVSDSSVVSITVPEINDVPVTVAPGTNKNQFTANLGTPRQPRLFLTGQTKAQNYNRVAHFRGLIFGAFGGKSGGDFRGGCHVVGNDEILRWTGSDAGTYGYSTNRAECLYWLQTNKRAGDGESGDVYVDDDWTELAARCNDTVGYSDANGNHFTGTRSTFNAIVEARKTQDVIRDICLFGRFTVPFSFEGRKRILLLKDEIIADVPTFRDSGSGQNIEPGALGLPSIRISKTQPYETINRVTIWFEDEEFDYTRRPLRFNDKRLQRARGVALNDKSQQILEKQYTAFGVTKFGEAVRLGNMLLDLGEFDSGGARNNLRVEFSVRAFDADVLGLHPYKVIRVVSRWLAPYNELTAEGENSGNPVQYFRILTLQRSADARMRIVAQQYNRTYYESLEDATQVPPRPGSTGSGAPAAQVVG